MITKASLREINPEQAREVLADFVARAEQNPYVSTRSELNSRIDENIATALASFIFQHGSPSKYPESSELAVLNISRSFSDVQGKVCELSEQPSSIYVSEYWKFIPGAGRRKYVSLPLDSLTDDDRHTGSAITGSKDYWPYLCGYFPKVHSGFLAVTADLTKKLIAR